MKIVVSDTFKKHFIKYRGKQKVNIESFCKLLNQTVCSNYHFLLRPYAKVKFFYGSNAIRMVIALHQDRSIIIPLLMSDKNNKQIGYNMTWEVVKNSILKMDEIISKEIDNDKFETYDF